MKKILLIILAVFILSGCELITNKEKLESIQSELDAYIMENDSIREQNITLQREKINLESEVTFLNSRIRGLENDLDEQESEISKQAYQIEQFSSKENALKNNISCSKYRDSIKNSITGNEQMLELFFSGIKNTCIVTMIATKNSFSDSGIPEIGYFRIEDVITGGGIDIFDCTSNNNCNSDFQKAVKELK